MCIIRKTVKQAFMRREYQLFIIIMCNKCNLKGFHCLYVFSSTLSDAKYDIKEQET